MRKFLAAMTVLVVLLAIGTALASITMTAGQVQSYAVGGVTQETNDTAAAAEMSLLWPNNVLVLRYQFGSGGNSFVQSQHLPSLTITINLSNGNWTTSDGRSGTLNANQLTNIQTTTKGWRNTAETFAINQSLVGGTQNAW